MMRESTCAWVKPKTVPPPSPVPTFSAVTRTFLFGAAAHSCQLFSLKKAAGHCPPLVSHLDAFSRHSNKTPATVTNVLIRVNVLIWTVMCK